MNIDDGSGKGYSVKVTEDLSLKILGATHDFASHAAELGDCYFWATSYDYAGGDTILWLANLNTTLNLHIDKIHVGSDTSTLVTVHSPAYRGDETGTDITGVNSNIPSGKVALADCIQDETNNVQANVLITGILPGTANIVYPVDGKIILGYHDCLAIDFTTTGTLGTCALVGYYSKDQ